MAKKPDSRRSIILALAANMSITVAKAAAAWVTGSGAMLAEAVHSLADTGNQGLLLLGLSRSRRPPSDEYPMGYGKAIYFWSFVVALLLFSIGGVYALLEGVHKWTHPQPLEKPVWAILVLLFSLLAGGASLRGCLQEIGRERGDRRLFTWFRDTRRSELLVVLGEDMAAMTGLGLALGAVVISLLTGDPRWDALGTLLIGVLLVVVAILVGLEVKGLLLGQGVAKEVRHAMLEFLGERAEIAEVYSLLSLHMGADVMVALKVRMDPGLDTAVALVDAINRCERAFRDRFPQVHWLFFEPDNQA